jgi:hypothetical protein
MDRTVEALVLLYAFLVGASAWWQGWNPFFFAICGLTVGIAAAVFLYLRLPD